MSVYSIDTFNSTVTYHDMTKNIMGFFEWSDLFSGISLYGKIVACNMHV